MDTHTPKYFVLQLGALIGLYTSVTALLLLLFSLINITFPDAAESYYMYESAQSTARGAIATLIVFFPTYLILTRLTNEQRRKQSEGGYTTVARWMIYLSLLIGGGIILGNLVTLILYFLNGEITIRFIFKVTTLFVVIGAAFTYYVLDIRGYFITRVQQSFYCALGALVLVASALVWGFANIETPHEVREGRLDDQQVYDLQDMQWRIEEYYRSEETLPQTIDMIFTVEDVPTAPEGRADYQYTVTGDRTYELCATFAGNSVESANTRSSITPRFEANYNWEHEAGEWCFKRTVEATGSDNN